MPLARIAVILTLFWCAASLLACRQTVSVNATSPVSEPGIASSNSVNTDVEKLKLLINIPYETDDVQWKQENGSRKRLIAVLRFDPDDARALVADAEKIHPAENVTVHAESWFPDEMTVQSAVSGEDELKAKAYAANQFYQEPYTSGRI